MPYTEKPIETLEELPDNLERIRQEVSEEKEKDPDPHFKLINPQELEDRDLEIWARYKNGELTYENFSHSDYYQEFWGKEKVTNLSKNRRIFAALILNKLLIKGAEKIIKKNDDQ